MSEVTCQNDECGYEWDYSGALKKATCPSCGYKTPVPDNDGDDDDES